MVFSLAKVLAAGPNSAYKAGDIVKLRDFETRTLKNPKYEAWVNNPMNKSNAKKVGEEPPEYISQLHTIFGPRVFMINPLAVNPVDTDWITYKVQELNVECLVKNPLKLLEL